MWLVKNSYSMLHANIPANKQVGFILNKTLQLNIVVPQSIFSLHAVTAEEPEGNIRTHYICFCGSNILKKKLRYLKFPVFVKCVHPVCTTCFIKPPGRVKLHLNSTVQRRAAEFKLQHEVNLQTEREQVAEVTHFT